MFDDHISFICFLKSHQEQSDLFCHPVHENVTQSFLAKAVAVSNLLSPLLLLFEKSVSNNCCDSGNYTSVTQTSDTECCHLSLLAARVLLITVLLYYIL